MQKGVFDHNFITKALKMDFGVEIYVFEVKDSDGAIYFAQWPWPCKVMTFVKSYFRPQLSY